MRLEELKFEPLPNGEFSILAQYMSEGPDPFYSTREKGRLSGFNGKDWIYVAPQHDSGVIALGLPEMEQIVAKMKELSR